MSGANNAPWQWPRWRLCGSRSVSCCHMGGVRSGQSAEKAGQCEGRRLRDYPIPVPSWAGPASSLSDRGPVLAVVTSRLPCAIEESPRRHKHVPFVNIAFLRSRSIKRRQWKYNLNYYGVVFAHLAIGCGIKAKDPSGLDSDRWIPHSRCCENPARAKALAGFSRHLSAGITESSPIGVFRYSL